MVEEKMIAKQGPPQFISTLIGKRITIRLRSGGQPIVGALEAYNPYELLIKTQKGYVLVYHNINFLS